MGLPIGTRFELISSHNAYRLSREVDVMLADIEELGGNVRDIHWRVVPVSGNNAIYTVGVLYEKGVQPEAEEEA